MAARLEDSLDSEIMSCGQDFWSANNEGDSNAFILPTRKKQKKDKRKVNQLLKAQKNKKLSKSQIKMQHKLEEDKKKSLLWLKSMEDIEKYKLPDDVYSLMWSSSKIGQVETVRERRRREVQFSNAGIALPQNDRPLKTGVNPRCETKTAISYISEWSAEIDPLPQVICNVPAFPESSKLLVDRSGLCITSGEAVSMSTEKEVAQESPHSTCKFEKTLKDTEIEKLKDHTSMGNLVKCTMSRVAAAPLVVHVTRPKEVEISRKDLPIIMMEQEIMEAINENSRVIICGETGCGKTTQVPQFLYEAGYGSAKSTDRRGGVTQPRRVAVYATAKRVAYELGQKLGKGVGYQVQHDKMVDNSCSIKFMTDGILLREVQNDILLRDYSVLILDEAHERSLNTDILIGMLSLAIQQRQKEYENQQLCGDRISPKDKIYPLKLIVMSATLRVEDFISENRIFPPPPVINVTSRQYYVEKRFSKQTEEVDYIGEAFKKIMSIHKKMRPGGILVFVTGAREVEFLCRQLRKASDDIVEINSRRNMKHESSSVPAENLSDGLDMEMMNEAFGVNSDSIDSQTARFSSYDDEDDGDFFSDNYDCSNDLESSDSELEGIDEEDMGLDGNISESFAEDVNLSSLKAAFEALSGKTSTSAEPDENKAVPSIPKQSSNQFAGPMRVLPLYAMLHPIEQLRVFENTKEGERLVVVATNVAETSLTIPGIKYVVDTGREKVKKYDLSNGIESFEIQCISKASADQRAGRAGRTGPGYCFRLYSSTYFNDKFDEFSKPQILKVPVDDIVLRLKSMGIKKVHKFPFPTPPERASLEKADSCLKALKALDMKGKLTPLGKAMSRYPLSPRQSRMLLTVIKLLRNTSNINRPNFVLGYAVATSSALSSSNPFVTRFDEVSKNANDKSRKKKIEEAFKSSRDKFSNPRSDALSVAYALQCFELSKNPNEFCDDNMLHYKTMEEMSKLRNQLLQLVFKESEKGDQPEFVWAHGTIQDVECSWRDFTEKSRLPSNEEDILCEAICAGWIDRVAKRTKKVPVSEGEMRVNATRYEACLGKETVFLNKRSSVSKSAPEFLVYSELIYSKRPYIHGATSVKPEWLVEYGGSLCNLKPSTDEKRYYDELKDQVLRRVEPTFGSDDWHLPSQLRPIKNVSEKVEAFAFCLLDGQILPSLKPDLKKFMRSLPTSILTSEGLCLKRVENLLNKLKKPKIIDSRAKLRELWDESPRELYTEIREWFQKGFGDQFDELWSKMQKEVKMDLSERFRKRAKRARS